MEITLKVDGQEYGPYTLVEVRNFLVNGEIRKSDYAYFEGCKDWVFVCHIPNLEVEEPSIYLWSEDLNDWEGPFVLDAINKRLKENDLTPDDYATGFVGSHDWSKVSDIPGIDISLLVKQETQTETILPDTRPIENRESKTVNCESSSSKKTSSTLTPEGRFAYIGIGAALFILGIFLISDNEKLLNNNKPPPATAGIPAPNPRVAIGKKSVHFVVGNIWRKFSSSNPVACVLVFIGATSVYVGCCHPSENSNPNKT